MRVFRSGLPVTEPTSELLVVGEAPATEDQIVPLRTSWCRKRLVTDHGEAGWPDEHFDCANVLDEPVAKFSLAAARVAVDVRAIYRYRRVLALGGAFDAVTGALCRAAPVVYDPVPSAVHWPGCYALSSRLGFVHVMRWPHPSGLCRVWNERQTMAFCYSALCVMVDPVELSWGAIDVASFPRLVPLRNALLHGRHFLSSGGGS